MESGPAGVAVLENVELEPRQEHVQNHNLVETLALEIQRKDVPSQHVVSIFSPLKMQM